MTQNEDEMKPQPTPEQIQMWQRIESSITEETIDREVRFWALPDEVKSYLASESLSSKIGGLAQRYQLDQKQAAGLSHAIKLLALGDVQPNNIVPFLHQFGIESGRASQLWTEVASLILKPIEKHLPHLPQTAPSPQNQVNLRKEAPPEQDVKTKPDTPSQGNVVNLRE